MWFWHWKGARWFDLRHLMNAEKTDRIPPRKPTELSSMKLTTWTNQRLVTARFLTRFNLWLRHDLWPHNASICDPARFVTKSASICDQRYTMTLESKLCRGKLVFVFTLIMYTKWYNMMIYIYELWYNTYINSGARSLMLFTLILFEYHAWHLYIIYHICVPYFMHHS